MHFVTEGGYPTPCFGQFIQKSVYSLEKIKSEQRSKTVSPSAFDILDRIEVYDIKGEKIPVPLGQTFSKMTEEDIQTEFTKTEINSNDEVVVTTNLHSMIGLLTEAVKTQQQEIKKIKEANKINN